MVDPKIEPWPGKRCKNIQYWFAITTTREAMKNNPWSYTDDKRAAIDFCREMDVRLLSHNPEDRSWYEKISINNPRDIFIVNDWEGRNPQVKEEFKSRSTSS